MSSTESKSHAAADFLNFVPAMFAMQNEFFHTVERANRDWLARAQSEATLVSNFVSKLTAARSIPAANLACQECAARQFAMFAEDGRRLWTDSQRLVENGLRIFSAPVASS
jgi:hypothetical protein